MGFAAIVWAFCLLTYPELGRRPGFLFTFAFAAEAGLLLLPILFSKWTPLAPISGAALFFFLAAWTENYLTDALLWWALGGYVVFAILHASFAFLPKPAVAGPPAVNTAWQSYLPLLPLALIWMCVSTNKASSAVWICVLLLDVVAIAVAFIRRSLPAIVIALLATIAAAGLWISVAPPEIDLLGFLTVAAGSGTFFFATALFAGRRFFPDSQNVRRNIPALAASMPFLLLLIAMAKLPIVNPTPFFITAFFLAVLLLGLGVVSRTSWIALVALGFTWAIEREWQALHFTNSYAALALGWQLAFFLIFLGYPFFSNEERKPLPWAVGALAGPLHFWLIYEIISATFPNLRSGFLPAAFAVPYAIGTFFLVNKKTGRPCVRRRAPRVAGWRGALFHQPHFPHSVRSRMDHARLGPRRPRASLVVPQSPESRLALRRRRFALHCLRSAALNPAVLEYHRRAATPIWNWYLYAYGITILCLFVGAWLFRPPRTTNFERTSPTLLYSLGAILTFLLLNIEIADYFSIGPTLTFSFSGNFARDMTYSIAWALYAFALLLIGMRQKTRWVRYSGVALLVVTLAKLFLHDLSSLE